MKGYLGAYSTLFRHPQKQQQPIQRHLSGKAQISEMAIH